MLAYRNVVLMILLCSLVIIALGWASSLLNIWLVLILILANLGAIFMGSLNICSGLYLKAHCSGNTEERKISITFDDGPHPTITARVLDLLEEYEIKAAFFLIGKNIEGNENIVKRIIDEGHIVASHSYSHSYFFGFWCSAKVLGDLRKNAQLIEQFSDKKINLFRPPFGVTNPNISKAVRSLDYSAVGWNIRSFDAIKKNVDKTSKRVNKRTKPGGVILFHDDHERILAILENVIKKTYKKGYKIVPLNELLNIKTYK